MRKEETVRIEPLRTESKLRSACLTPTELGLLAKRLAATKNRQEASRLRKRLRRGFYEI